MEKPYDLGAANYRLVVSGSSICKQHFYSAVKILLVVSS